MAKTKSKAKAKAKSKAKPAKAKAKPAKAKAKAKTKAKAPARVSAIPKGYHAITPYLVLDGCARALDWYRDVFGAKELLRMPMPGGIIGHAELLIGDSIVMMADPQPPNHNTTDSGMCLYVTDCDEVFARAVAAGATVLNAIENKFYGDRMGTVRDPFGQKWSIGTHMEDVSPKEMERRMASLPMPS